MENPIERFAIIYYTDLKYMFFVSKCDLIFMQTFLYYFSKSHANIFDCRLTGTPLDKLNVQARFVITDILHQQIHFDRRAVQFSDGEFHEHGHSFIIGSELESIQCLVQSFKKKKKLSINNTPCIIYFN